MDTETILNNTNPKMTLLTEEDIAHFRSGTHYHIYNKLGSHFTTSQDGVKGVFFAVWAPNARQVSVIGDFNKWDAEKNKLELRPDASGIWEAFVPQIEKGTMYKYSIVSTHNNYRVEKRDPYSFYCEVPPARASIVWDLDYEWNDSAWVNNRARKNSPSSPVSVYELHFGSWQRCSSDDPRYLTYTEMAERLIPYIKKMGFTHVEFMPLTAHPLYESWGYQTDGYFAPASRYGNPQELMALIDKLHQNEIGVIFDWVPSHFPFDRHGLAFFDGTHLYEHADPRKGFHPEWKSSIFNYGRNEVKEFLISSALFWLDKYHVDGLRVDGGSSMLYLDYARKRGEWVPNKYGGRENLEAVDFLKELNETIGKYFSDAQVAIEEATSWPNLSRPVSKGGLGFGMKWNMGWMHDTLQYFSKNPHERRHIHNKITFSMCYAFNENFLLALSHDEVVHGKRSLINKMPGDEYQKFANMRLLYGYMYAHPGKKLMFMGGEFGQWAEWSHARSLDWHLSAYPKQEGLMRWVADLNNAYKEQPALHENDFSQDGFEWIDCSDAGQSVISFIRKSRDRKDTVLCVFNFSLVTYNNYRVGVPEEGYWKELLNSNAKEYQGTGLGNYGGIFSENVSYHGRKYSVVLTLPPLSALYFRLPESVPSAQEIIEAIVPKDDSSSSGKAE
jgi:1,4-alpha-glucan branching enzyme